MKIIILGAGEVGFNIAKQLINENKNVVIIEKVLDRVKYVVNRLDCLVVQGDGTNINILNEINFEKDDIFIAVTDSDEVNLISSLIVNSEFNLSKIVTRIRKIEYERTKIFKSNIISATYIVNPDVEAARTILNIIEEGAVSDVFLFDKDIQMRSFYVGTNLKLVNKMLKEIKNEIKGDYIVAGVLRGNNIIVPSGNTKIYENDQLYIVGKKSELEKFFLKSGVSIRKLKNVIVVGGINISEIVLSKLLKMKINVKLVDKNYEICKVLSEKYDSLTVINEDITTEEIFEEEGLTNYDLIITTTENEELNILTAIYAKSLGIKRAIALVNKQSYISMSNKLGLDSIVSPKQSSVNTILKYIRHGHVKSIYTIFDGKAEAIEYTVTEKDILANKPLKYLELPHSSLIVSVNRKNNNYIPDGNFVIEPGDNIIIFSKREAINKIDNLLS